MITDLRRRCGLILRYTCRHRHRHRHLPPRSSSLLLPPPPASSLLLLLPPPPSSTSPSTAHEFSSSLYAHCLCSSVSSIRPSSRILPPTADKSREADCPESLQLDVAKVLCLNPGLSAHCPTPRALVRTHVCVCRCLCVCVRARKHACVQIS
jgi:hypothetical protein